MAKNKARCDSAHTHATLVKGQWVCDRCGSSRPVTEKEWKEIQKQTR